MAEPAPATGKTPPPSEKINDWRKKCIETFQLQPIPEAWKDQVARGSERAWEKYYKWRKTQEKKRQSKSAEEDTEEGIAELLEDWECELDGLEDEVFGEEAEEEWWTTLSVGNVVWEDYNELRTCQFYAHVWSPYAIPHAVQLEHRYHQRVRYSSIEFYATWGYKLLDFEQGPTRGEYTTICSNHFEDEELRADVIETANLNKQTLDRLRRFLFGTVDASKQVCNDFSFLRLLFGSMGTFDNKTVMCGSLGYEFALGYEDDLRKQLIKEGVIQEDEYPSIHWLEYAMRKAAGALRPIDRYYKAPTIKDAPGYRSPSEEGYGSSSEEGYSY